jgi:type II secretory pathway component PulM
MKHALSRLWAARSPREHRLIAVTAICLGLALYAWLLQATTQARLRLLPAVAQLRAEAIRQGEQADEIVRLRAMPPLPRSTTDLRQLVQRQVDVSGLTRSLVSIELVDAHRVKLAFAGVAFADWLALADAMRAQQLRFAAVRIESRSAPGQVSVAATVERPGR